MGCEDGIMGLGKVAKKVERLAGNQQKQRLNQVGLKSDRIYHTTTV